MARENFSEGGSGEWVAVKEVNAKLTQSEPTEEEPLQPPCRGRVSPDGKTAEFEGTLKVKASEEIKAGDIIFHLPVGLRPQYRRFLVCVIKGASTVAGVLVFLPNGGVESKQAVKENEEIILSTLDYPLT